MTARPPAPADPFDSLRSLRAWAELGRFKPWVVGVAVGLILALACGPRDAGEPRLLRQGDPLASVAEWRKVFDEVPAADPDAVRAREVFERVRAASGQHAELVVLEMGRRPIALALADPSVVLSTEGLALCYRGVPPEAGDARLAFVLGHELAHLKNGDFWHASAFATVRELAGDDEEARALQALLASDPRDRKKAELRADDEGALALTLAAFDPAAVFARDRSFFEEWVGSVPGRLAYQDPEHPGPAERARFLQERLAGVAGRVHLFHEGVEAYESGDYDAAVARFEELGRLFQGREVLNNLALAHYQLAARKLAGCDGLLVTRFRLPTLLDPVTLAERAVLRGEGRSSPCFDNAEYRRHAAEAIRLLGEAAARDPAYLPARVNLVAALVLDEQGARGVLAGEEAAALAPDDPDALGARAAAYLAYAETGSTFVSKDRVLEELAALHRRFPDDAAIAYNLARALSFAARPEEARPVWRELLRIEPEDGPWAEIARGWVGEDRLAGPTRAEL